MCICSNIRTYLKPCFLDVAVDVDVDVDVDVNVDVNDDSSFDVFSLRKHSKRMYLLVTTNHIPKNSD